MLHVNIKELQLFTEQSNLTWSLIKLIYLLMTNDVAKGDDRRYMQTIIAILLGVRPPNKTSHMKIT